MTPPGEAPGAERVTSLIADAARQAAGRIGRGSLGVLTQNLLNLVALRYVSHVLGAAEYGRVGTSLFFSMQACQFLQWGLNPLLTRDIVRGREPAARLLGAFVRQKQVAALAMLLLALPVAALLQARGQSALVLLGTVDGVVLGFSVVPAFDSRGRLATWFAIAHLRPGLYLLGTIALATLAPSRLGAVPVMAVHAGALAVAVALEWAWSVREHGAPRTDGALPRAWALWREAAPLGAGEAAAQLLAYLGVPAVAWLGHAAEAGALTLSHQLAVSVSSFAAVPGQVLHAHLAGRADPRAPGFRREVLGLTGALVALSCLACLAGVLLAPALVPALFGADYRGAARLFQVDAWRLVGTFGAVALASGLICQGRAVTLSACQVAGLAVTLAALLLFVPAHGAIAAAAAAAAGRATYLAAAAAAFVLPARRPGDAGAR